MTEPTALTFEEGYSRLQTIAKRVTSEEVPVAEMCDLFAEGKGLQKSLTVYLDEQKSRVEAIERGEGIQAFRIVAPSDDKDAVDERDAAPGAEAPEDDFGPSAPPASAPADDDIPF
jgi:exodeoxyribonuclease VII small subunit